MTRPQWKRLLIQAVLMTVLLVIPMYFPAAQDASQKPCADEIAKYCNDVQPGEGGILKCLKAHEPELSGFCRDKLNSALKRKEEAKQACAKDIEKYCADITPGGGRLINCLKPHFNELATECREKLTVIKTRYKGAKSPSGDGSGQ
jgi:hypothetical protein